MEVRARLLGPGFLGRSALGGPISDSSAFDEWLCWTAREALGPDNGPPGRSLEDSPRERLRGLDLLLLSLSILEMAP